MMIWFRYLWFALGFLALFAPLPLHAVGCDPSAYGRLAESADSFKKRLQDRLGRALGPAEVEAVQQAHALERESYTSQAVLNHDAQMRRAGLSAGEIRQLRAQGLIRASELAPAVPERLSVAELELRPVGADVLRASSAGTRYVVDDQNQIFLVPSGHSFALDSLWVVRDSRTNGMHVIREAGTLRSQGGALHFHPENQTDLSQAEVQAALDRVRPTGGAPLVRATRESAEQSRVFSCMDVLARQSNFRSAIMDRLIGDNLVLLGAFVTTELAGAARLASREGRQVMMADLIGTNINSVVGSVLGRFLVGRNSSLPVSLATRTGVAMGMIEVQKGVYNLMLEDRAEERAERIAAFDRAYFFARLPIAHYTDRFIMRQLPDMLYDACKRDSSVRIFLSPRSIRIAERFGSTVLYYGARQAVVGE